MSSSDRLLDEGTARAVNSGRETAGVMLRTIQKRLQKVFIAFVVGLFVGIIAMRNYIWPSLKHSLITNPHVTVIYQTPFDVFLFQVKVGIIVGAIFALPVLLYYARGPLREREFIPDITVPYWQLASLAVFALVFLVAGMAYAYDFFFPLLFGFLANNAVSASLKPMYSIIMWTEFILYLTVSFGLVSEVPLIMGALSYSGLVPYETFRRYWKHTFVVIWGCGAIFTPPDVFTQTLWAVPVTILYAFSLYVSKVATMVNRGEQRVSAREAVDQRWNVVAGVTFVAALAGYALVRYGALDRLAAALSNYGVDASALTGLSPVPVAVGLGALALVVTLGYVVYAAISEAAAAEAAVYGGKEPKPENLNLDILDAEGVRAAPDERFYAMDEEEAVQLAGQAMENDDPDKAQAILDRFDSAEEAKEADEELAELVSEDDSDRSEPASAETEAEAAEGEGGNVLSRTSAGMLDAFTEDDTTEDDIGGYYHDIAFIVDSLRSRLFLVVGWFMVVLSVVFYYLYQGALRTLKVNFLSKLPPQIVGTNELQVVTLHPVEALIFEAKFSLVVAAIFSIPLVLYLAWPAMEERGIIRAPRRIVALWFVGLVGALAVGSIVGYLYVAPYIISWLVLDAHQANMIVSYRVSNFLWLVFLTTAGIGLLADVPITMWLLYLSDLVSFHTLYERWRVPVIASFVVGALVTPSSVYTMLIVAVPLAIAYLFGLGVLYVVTLGGRRGGGGSGEQREAVTDGGREMESADPSGRIRD